MPPPEDQDEADLFLFKDPHKRRRAIDHFECLADTVAYDIDSLCRAAKEACNREHLAGAFYGYLQEVVWNNGFFGQRLADADVAHTAAARSGHAGLAKVLASPNVDFLSSPYSYGFRGAGGEGGFMSPEASVRRAGKLWISEEDMRTHLWSRNSFYGQTRDTRETAEVLKRQMANIITHSAGAWWCDWGKQEGGAYAEPELMEVFRRSLDIYRRALDLPDRSSAAEIAVVIDAESWFYRSTLNNFDIPAWRNRAWGISRMGAPVDGILLSDLLEGRARDYKLYLFVNAFHFSDQNRGRLKSALRRDGKVAVWQWAPGFASDDALSAEHCHDLTGIRLRMTPRQWSANIFISNFEHDLTRDLPTSTFWGTDMRLGPLFTVDDPRGNDVGHRGHQPGALRAGLRGEAGSRLGQRLHGRAQSAAGRLARAGAICRRPPVQRIGRRVVRRPQPRGDPYRARRRQDHPPAAAGRCVGGVLGPAGRARLHGVRGQDGGG